MAKKAAAPPRAHTPAKRPVAATLPPPAQAAVAAVAGVRSGVALTRKQIKDREYEQLKANAPKGGIVVRATKVGFYNNERKRVGDVFKIAHLGEFSDKWMTTAPKGAKLKTTSAPEALAKENQDLRELKHGGGTMPEPAGDDDDPLGAD